MARGQIDDALDRRDVNDRGFALTEQWLARVGAAEEYQTTMRAPADYLELQDVYV